MKNSVNTKARLVVVLMVLTFGWLGAVGGSAVTSVVDSGESVLVGTVVSEDNTPWD